jgi:cell division septation protein DedD
MRLDYSEKKGGRDKVERPVQKNRPRKEPGGLFALLSTAVLLLTFGVGVLTGWLLFKKTHKASPVVAAVQPAKNEASARGAEQAGTTPPAAQLTFYKTLPDGGKGVIGSGLNLKKPESAASAPHPPAATTRPAPVAPHTAPVAPAEGADPAEGQQEAAARFVVQVASYREQQEADKAQARLVGKGIAAYVMESRLKDNVVWYRVRVGRHLTKVEAGEIAGKAGKGATVLPE